MYRVKNSKYSRSIVESRGKWAICNRGPSTSQRFCSHWGGDREGRHALSFFLALFYYFSFDFFCNIFLRAIFYFQSSFTLLQCVFRMGSSRVDLERGGMRCAATATAPAVFCIFSLYILFLLSIIWILFWEPFLSSFTLLHCGGLLERGGMRCAGRSCNCSSCELQSTPRPKLPVAERPPPKHHSPTRAQNVMFSC